MILLIDFDGTIENRKAAPPGKHYGPPEEGAVAALRYLHQQHTIIVFTGEPVNQPATKRAIADYMWHFQIPYDDITNVKPKKYDYIIDNQAIHFDEWKRVLVKLAKTNEASYIGDVDVPK